MSRRLLILQRNLVPRPFRLTRSGHAQMAVTAIVSSSRDNYLETGGGLLGDIFKEMAKDLLSWRGTEIKISPVASFTVQLSF